MGGVVSSFIRQLDPSKEVEQQLQETLNILVKLAETKLESFKIEMDSSWTKQSDESLAPGTFKDYQTEKMNVLTSTDTSGLTKGLGDLVDSAFALGTDANAQNVGKFIKTLVGQGLEIVLGSGSASENQHKTYIIYPDGNALCRCDIWMWRYSMTSKGFQTKLQNVLIFRMQYGAVDITKVDPVALSHWFGKWNLDIKLAEEMLNRARELIEHSKKPVPTNLLRGSLGSADPLNANNSNEFNLDKYISERAEVIKKRGISIEKEVKTSA